MAWGMGLRIRTLLTKGAGLLSILLLVAATCRGQDLPAIGSWSPALRTALTLDVPEQDDLNGGHLQGVQLHEGRLYVSGSSDQFAYLSIFAEQEEGFRFIGVKKLGDRPFHHAGGFQLSEQWLAIGIENPRTRTESMVQLYDVSSSKTFTAPVFVLHRKGQQGRSTAGAVALLRRADHFLLAVGSWNSTVIDLYVSNGTDPYAPGFDFSLWTSWDSREALRKNWSDRDYGSYQSLQLSEDSTGVYLTGFCKDKKVDRADMFRVVTDADPYSMVQKVGSAVFPCSDGTSFRFGSGYATMDGKPQVLAVSHDLMPSITLQLFSPTGD